MKSYRTLAGMLYACGLLCLLLGLEQVGIAQGCSQIEFSSATCTSAHEAPPFENGSGSYCEWVNNVCQATSSTQCVDRWGLAIAGTCEPEGLKSGQTHTCFQNAFSTFVDVIWYEAECMSYNGVCECHWEPSSTTQPLAVCECYDIDD